jgi:hypothetical protein
MKYDEGKPNIALIPPEALLDIAKVFTFGAKKYGANNWRIDGAHTSWSRTYGSIQRHLTSWLAGEDVDPESGESHLTHAATQIMILMTYQSDGVIWQDDRYSSIRKEKDV